MGSVYAEIELVNNSDLVQVRLGDFDPDLVRKIRITALVDSGAINMAINENIQEYLQLPVIGQKKAELADGRIVVYKLVDQLVIRFGDRECLGRGVILPGDSEPLLGVIPLEDMDLIIDPLRRELTYHPERMDMAMTRTGKLI